MITLKDLQSATLAAKKRTGRDGLGTRVKQGRFQVVDVSYNKRGVSRVAELSGWADAGSIIAFLNRIG